MSENGRVPLHTYVDTRMRDLIELMDKRFEGSDRLWTRALTDADERSKQRDEAIRETALTALSDARSRRSDGMGLIAVLLSTAALVVSLVLHFMK